jgi:2-polyprenyl-6-methoxyphenol hydroxylase-like FAD-dependent oxidoreductase
MQPSGVKVLERLGVLDSLLKVAVPIERLTLALDDVRIELGGITELFGAPGLNVRRVTLDAILLDAAAAAGAEVRTQTAVTGLVEDGGRVAGVKTRFGELRAPLVVGADGTGSSVARLVNAAEYHQTPSGRIFAWGYFEGAGGGADGMWLGKAGELGFLASQTDAGLFMAAVAPSMDREQELLGDLEAGYAAGLARWPELDASLAGAKRVGPIRVMARWHGYFRQSAGPGWVLVGDAGHFKDPTPGQGISDALRQVAELAPAIEQALGGAGAADQVLHDWWSWRDRDAWEMYWFARDMGAPGPTPLLVQAMQRRIAADPQLTEGLMRILNRDLAPSKVFTPSLALAVTTKALLRSRGRRRVLLREARTLVADELRHRVAARHLPARQPEGRARMW